MRAGQARSHPDGMRTDDATGTRTWLVATVLIVAILGGCWGGEAPPRGRPPDALVPAGAPDRPMSAHRLGKLAHVFGRRTVLLCCAVVIQQLLLPFECVSQEFLGLAGLSFQFRQPAFLPLVERLQHRTQHRLCGLLIRAGARRSVVFDRLGRLPHALRHASRLADLCCIVE